MGRISPELVLVDPELGELLRELLPEPGDCLAPRPPLPRALTTVAVDPVVRVPPSPSLQPLTTVGVDPVALPAPAPSRPVPPRRRPTKPRSRTHLLAWIAVAGVLASPLLAFVTVTDYPPFPALPPSASSGSDDGPASTSKPGRAGAAARPSAAGTEPTGTTSKAVAKAAAKGTSATSKAAASRAAKPSTSKQSTSASQKRATDGPSASTPDSDRAVIEWPAQPRALFYSLILVRAGERLDFRAPTNAVELRSGRQRPPAVYHWFVYPAFGSESEPTYGRLLADGTVRLSPGSIRLG